MMHWKSLMIVINKTCYNKTYAQYPDDAAAYAGRGIAKANAGLSYCSDYKKACELGIKRVCEVYNDQCR